MKAPEVGDKIRFKGCVGGYTCVTCKFTACKKMGNFDLEGWRYDVIRLVSIDNETNIMLMTEQNVRLYEEHVHFYTYEPPNEVTPFL